MDKAIDRVTQSCTGCYALSHTPQACVDFGTVLFTKDRQLCLPYSLCGNKYDYNPRVTGCWY